MRHELQARASYGNGKVNSFLEAVRNSVGTAGNLIDLKTNYVDKIKNQSSNKGVGLNLTHLDTIVDKFGHKFP